MNVLTLIFGVLLLFLILICARLSPNAVTITIPDIGKADCIILSTGTKTVMIDTGEAENVEDIIEVLDAQKVETIDILILSHFDKDHIGGAAELIQRYNITTVLESDYSSERQEYTDYHDTLSEKGCSPLVLTEDYSFTSDNCLFTVNIPKETSYGRKEDNNSSLIVTMEWKGFRFLFCGDAMEERISEFLLSHPGEFDFVKLPYHGNYLENYAEFLDEISPKYGIITCSKKNPANEHTLELLTQYGVSVYETENGTVHAEVDSRGIYFCQ